MAILLLAIVSGEVMVLPWILLADSAWVKYVAVME